MCKLISLFILVITINGCATIANIPPQGGPLNQVKEIKDYKLGLPKTVTTGSVMLEKQEGIESYILTIDPSWAAPNGQFTFWVATPPPGYDNLWFSSPLRLTDTSQLEAINAYKQGRGKSVVFGRHDFANRIPWGDFKAQAIPPDQLVLKEGVVPNGGVKEQLLYNGKHADKTISITYREFKDDFARPAFYQDLSYDLNESKKISFRNYSINIIDATNNQISFVVEKD